MHGDPGLRNYGDVNLIEGYAKNFGLDPDVVYEQVSFDTLIMFSVKWKRESEYQERKEILERMMTNPQS